MTLPLTGSCRSPVIFVKEKSHKMVSTDSFLNYGNRNFKSRNLVNRFNLRGAPRSFVFLKLS